MTIATIFQWSWWMQAVGPNEVASLIWEIPTAILAYSKAIKPIFRHLEEAREHRRWTYDAIHALHRGEPLPDHPHYSEARKS